MRQREPAEDLWRYGDPASHQAVSALIRHHSTNGRDVRDVVLAGRELTACRDVLDLGCGFGFMAEAVAPRLHAEACITAVDAVSRNRLPVQRRGRRAGRRVEFHSMVIDDRLPWPAASYDLVLCTYSLYYFPAVLPQIARVLRPDGHFLAITHSLDSIRAMLQIAGLPAEQTALFGTVRRFCSENGHELLSRSFEETTRIDYPNSLLFRPDEVDSLLRYLRFKFRFLSDWPVSEPEFHTRESRDLRDQFAAQDILLEKNDTAFWCSRPLGG